MLSIFLPLVVLLVGAFLGKSSDVPTSPDFISSESTLHIFHLYIDIPLLKADSCAGQEVTITETLRVDQDIVNITMPACPGFTPKSHPVDPSESLLACHQAGARELVKRSLAITSDVSATSPSECVNPSICQCGQACKFCRSLFTYGTEANQYDGF